MSLHKIDGHGHIDIYEETDDFSEIKLFKSRKGSVIEGVALNMLLRGMFSLFCDYNEKVTIPGGIHCWETIVEPVYVSILYFASVDEVMSRVLHIMRQFYVNRLTQYSEAANGSMSFLYYWVFCYRTFISDSSLYLLHGHIEVLSDSVINYDITSVDTVRLLQLRDITISTLRARTVVPSIFKCDEPNLHQETRGRWTGREVQLRREQLIESIAKAPKFKLEIFGGDLLMDSFGDESDEESLPGRDLDVQRDRKSVV